MHMKNQPPIFVPQEYRSEIERLSKAALMDLVWDFAVTAADDPADEASVMDAFRERRGTILMHRQQAKAA